MVVSDAAAAAAAELFGGRGGWVLDIASGMNKHNIHTNRNCDALLSENKKTKQDVFVQVMSPNAPPCLYVLLSQ